MRLPVLIEGLITGGLIATIAGVVVGIPAIVATLIAARLFFGPWGTMDDARVVFETHADRFIEMQRILESLPEIKIVEVRTVFQNPLDENPRYQNLEPSLRSAYEQLISIAKDSKVQSVQVDVDMDGHTVSSTYMLYGRGIGGDTEIVSVDHCSGACVLYRKGYLECEPAHVPDWYVCHRR